MGGSRHVSRWAYLELSTEAIHKSNLARSRAYIEPSTEALQASCRAVHQLYLDRTICRSTASEPSGRALGRLQPNYPRRQYPLAV